MENIHYSVDTTYNLVSTVYDLPHFRKSVFSHHELKAGRFSGQINTPQQPDWITGILLCCAILLAWNHVYNPARLLQVVKAPFSKRFINQLIREGNLFNERISFTLLIMFLIILSLFVYIVNEHFSGYTVYNLRGILLYLIILAGIAAFMTVKVSLIFFIGIIFKTQETTYHYLLNQLIFSIILAPLLLLFSIVLVYIGDDFFFYFSLIFILIVFLIQFFRGFFIGMALTRFSYLLLFMYLCSLEILPLLVATKIVLNIAKTAVV